MISKAILISLVIIVAILLGFVIFKNTQTSESYKERYNKYDYINDATTGHLAYTGISNLVCADTSPDNMYIETCKSVMDANPQFKQQVQEYQSRHIKEPYGSGEHVMSSDGLVVTDETSTKREFHPPIVFRVPDVGDSNGRDVKAGDYKIPMAWAKTRTGGQHHTGYTFGTLLALSGDVFWTVDQVSDYRKTDATNLQFVTKATNDNSCVDDELMTADGDAIMETGKYTAAFCTFLRAFYSLYKPNAKLSDSWALNWGGVTNDGAHGDASSLGDNADAIFQHEINVTRYNIENGRSDSLNEYDVDSDYASILAANPDSSTWKPDCYDTVPGADGKFWKCSGEFSPGARYEDIIDATIKTQLGPLHGTKYIKLASTNNDHFAADAWFTYAIGHHLAIKQMGIAKTKSNFEEKQIAFNKGLAIEAFANHFLTDLFAGGHFSNPARAIRNRSMRRDGTTDHSSVPGTATEVVGQGFGGTFVKAMHDELNAYGNEASNGDGTEWKSFGDGSWANPKFTKGRGVLHDAIQTSVDEVMDSFWFAGFEIPAFGVFAAFKKIPSPEDWNSGLTPMYHECGKKKKAKARYKRELPAKRISNDLGTGCSEHGNIIYLNNLPHVPGSITNGSDTPYNICNPAADPVVNCDRLGPPTIWQDLGVVPCETSGGTQRVCARIDMLDELNVPLFTMSEPETSSDALNDYGGKGHVWRRRGRQRSEDGHMVDLGGIGDRHGHIAATTVVIDPTGKVRKGKFGEEAKNMDKDLPYNLTEYRPFNADATVRWGNQITDGP
jgi:hypothetical protein